MMKMIMLLLVMMMMASAVVFCEYVESKHKIKICVFMTNSKIC